MADVLALTRPVSPRIDRCELTHLPRTPIDFDKAVSEHRSLERALASLGCRLRRLPAAPELPDSVFVEDTAVVLPQVAVLARPGAPSRRAEVPAVAEALAEYRPLRAIEPPGTLDGGDVFSVGRTLFVGLSTRTNEAGAEQLAGHVGPYGYRVRPVPVRSLHLKTAITPVAKGVLLFNPDWVDPGPFRDEELVEVDSAEPFAANAVPVGGALLYPKAYPRTRRRLEAVGLNVLPVEASELAKAEGGLSCCCLLFEVSGEP